MVRINEELIRIIVLSNVRIVHQIVYNVNLISLIILNANHNIPYLLTLFVLLDLLILVDLLNFLLFHKNTKNRGIMC